LELERLRGTETGSGSEFGNGGTWVGGGGELEDEDPASEIFRSCGEVGIDFIETGFGGERTLLGGDTGEVKGLD
jgi:hypothetical protein